MNDAVQAGQTALAGWGDLVPIILFLVIGAVISARKKKAENEAMRMPKPQEGASAPARRQAPAPSAEDHEFEDGENEEHWEGEERQGEQTERWNDHKGREAPNTESRAGEDRTAPATSGPREAWRQLKPEAQRNLPQERSAPQQGPIIPGRAKEKATEIGKDILGQLAKELGLELPKDGTAPKPIPARVPSAEPAPATRAPNRESARKASTGAHTPRGYSTSPDEVRARAAETARAKPSLPRVAAPVAVVAKEVFSQASLAARDLNDPDALGRAFVLQTILGKPLSMRPRVQKDA